MKDGKLVFYDESIGRGRIESSSGKFVVAEDDMAPDARVEGAFVQFDVEHDEPHERAINVVLREGTHNNPNQRRFGDSD